MSATADSQPAVSPENSGIAQLRALLVTPLPDDGIWGWAWPLLVTVFAGVLRFDRLSSPNAIIFDETYYAKDAWSILKHGVEWYWVNPASDPGYANNQIIAGHFSQHLFQACSGAGCGEYVVQPELGKLLMAVGEWLYGLTTLGWRFTSAVFGTLAILVMCRVARRLTRSTLLGCTAGLLLSLDGLEFVLSRTGILDIFLMFFVLAAFGALVVDRDVSRARLAEAVVLRPVDEAGPGLGIRKWRVIAGIMLGLACASKQYGAWYVFAFAALCIAWDTGARRTAGLPGYKRGALVRDGKWLLLTLGVIPLVTYLLTWMNWFITSTGYDRDYAQQHGISLPVISQLYSLYEYHKEMLQFGVGLSVSHPYESQPWDWFVMRAGGVLLGDLQRPGRAARRAHHGSRAVRVRSAGDREPGHLVGVAAGDRGLPRLVADPPRLAGRGGPAVHRRRVGHLAAVRLADQVLLLRPRVRAVRHHLHRAVRRADPRPGRRIRPTQGDRGAAGRCVRHRGPGAVLVLLPDHDGRGHPVPGVVVAHLVPRLAWPRSGLDLTRCHASRTHCPQPRSSGKFATRVFSNFG